jgi:hypothetical protein
MPLNLSPKQIESRVAVKRSNYSESESRTYRRPEVELKATEKRAAMIRRMINGLQGQTIRVFQGTDNKRLEHGGKGARR